MLMFLNHCCQPSTFVVGNLCLHVLQQTVLQVPLLLYNHCNVSVAGAYSRDRRNPTRDSKVAPLFHFNDIMHVPKTDPRAAGAAQALALLSARGLDFFDHDCRYTTCRALNQINVFISFQATIPSITVNGFTQDTAKDMFTLGLCTNPNRTTDAENVRRHIKRGVRLTYIGGEVFAECISDSPIFIQSASSNARYKWNKTTVCKVPPGCHLKIFNNEEFAAALRDAVSKVIHKICLLEPCKISQNRPIGQLFKNDFSLQIVCVLYSCTQSF